MGAMNAPAGRTVASFDQGVLVTNSPCVHRLWLLGGRAAHGVAPLGSGDARLTPRGAHGARDDMTKEARLVRSESRYASSVRVRANHGRFVGGERQSSCLGPAMTAESQS